MSLTTRFTDELMAEGLTKRILTLVSDISVNGEFERLQKERGLGNEKHRKEVSDIQGWRAWRIESLHVGNKIPCDSLILFPFFFMVHLYFILY